MLLALGFLVLFLQLVPLARTAWERRHYVLVHHSDSWTGTRYQARVTRADDEPTLETAAQPRRGVPLASHTQLALGLAACVVALPSFFPQIINASEVSNRYHHLDHAGQFFVGGRGGGLVLGSLPYVSRRLGDHSSTGLATVLAAPMLMMLVMVPRIYEPLESKPIPHALYHLTMAAFGFATGLGATRLGLVTGRVMIALSLGRPLMFAAAMK